MSSNQAESEKSVASVSDASSIQVGEKVVVGFSVGYVQRIGDKTMTVSYDKEGNFTLEKRVESSRVLRATKRRVTLANLAEAEYKRFDKLKHEHTKNLKDLSDEIKRREW